MLPNQNQYVITEAGSSGKPSARWSSTTPTTGSRLTRATYSGAYTYTFAYAYDPIGNRTTQRATITSTQVTNYVYDAANRLTSVNGQAYTWDDNGNLLNDSNAVYAYDQANRLISATLGVTTTRYAYNGDGARLKQVVNGSPITYTLDLAAPLVQVLVATDSSGDTRYLYGVTRVGEQQSAGWVYHLSDALGSVRQLADANAQVVLARGYTPYGEPLWSQGSGQSAYGFTDENFDVSTGLVFLRARYLQPGLGVFLMRDPLDGSLWQPISMNGWNYALGNPIAQSDPSGLCTEQHNTALNLLGIRVCRVDPGDIGVLDIARHFDWADDPWKVVHFNEAFREPDWGSRGWPIHPGESIFIPKRPSNAPRPAEQLADVPQLPSGFMDSDWLIDGYIRGGNWTAEFPHDTSSIYGVPPNAPCGVVGGGTGWETIYDLYDNKKAYFTYNFALYNKDISLGSLTPIGAYEGLMTGFSRGANLGHYSQGRSKCAVAPTTLLGVDSILKPSLDFSLAVCGPAQQPWELPGLMEHEVVPQFVPGRIWSLLFEGSFTITAARVAGPSVTYARYWGPFHVEDLSSSEREYAIQQIATAILGAATVVGR